MGREFNLTKLALMLKLNESFNIKNIQELYRSIVNSARSKYRNNVILKFENEESIAEM